MQKTLFLKLSTDLLDKSIELVVSAEKEELKTKKYILKISKEIFDSSGQVLNEVFGGKNYTHPDFDDLKNLSLKKCVQVGHFSTILKEIYILLFDDKNGLQKVGKIHLDLNGSIEISEKNLKKLKTFEKKIESIVKLK